MNEKEFYKKARKLQKIREAKGRYIQLDPKTKIWIEANENEQDKIRQFKDKLNKFRNRTKN